MVNSSPFLRTRPCSLSGRTPPQLLEPLVPTAPVPIIPITNRVFLVVVLVVLLGRIELARLGNLGDDRPLEGFGLLQRLLRLQGQQALLLAVVENPGAVLGTDVAGVAVDDR